MANRPNPSAIKTALDAGATFSNGLVVVSGVGHYCKLDNTTDPENPVWDLDPVEGVRVYNQTHFNMMKNGGLLTDPGEYQWCFDTFVGQLQLLQVNVGGTDYAFLSDP